MSQFTNRKFGERGLEDLVEFDLWLMKMEIAARRPSPSPSPKASPSSSGAPAPSKGPESDKPTDLGDITPAQKEAYKSFWKQFQQPAKPATISPKVTPKVTWVDTPVVITPQSSSAAAPSPATERVITPKRLALDALDETPGEGP